jgi:PAS domain S-box-containing protein
MISTPPLSSYDTLQTWRINALNWILHGQFPFWVLAYLAGIWNAVQTYQEKSQASSNTFQLFILAISIFTILLIWMAVITFIPGLGYRFRVSALLGIYYGLSVILFILSALSGDARGFLFAFVVLAAIFLDPPWNLISLAMAMLAFAAAGLLNATGIVQIAAEHGYNASDPSAWFSGGVVFGTLSISTSLGITYLLRSFAGSLTQVNQSLQNEQRVSTSFRLLSDINQLIVRKVTPPLLFGKTCQIIFDNGYEHACIGLLQSDGDSFFPELHAGNNPPAMPECALQAIRTRTRIIATPNLIVPILRPSRDFGVLVIGSSTPFNDSEILLFQELADDLAYALENIETENQRRAIAEIAAPLLTAHDETKFWSAALQAVQTVLRTDRAAIYVYEYGADRLTCPFATGISQEYIDEVNRRFREVPGARLFLDPKPVPVNDTESNPLAAPLRLHLMREGIRSYCVFPLFSSQKLLGAFVSYRNAAIPFSQSDLEAGQTLAHLVAASLQNVRLFNETRAKANEQAALFIAAQELSASLLNPPALLEAFAKQLATTLNASSVYIISFDPEGETLKVLSEFWSEFASTAERKSDLGRVYRATEYPHVLEAMRSGKALTLQADEEKLTEAERNEYIDYGAHTKLFVPLMWQGRLVGYTEIWESRYKREFTQHEINLAQALSSHAASVIHATNLFAELKKRESFFHAITENAMDGVAVVNAEGNFTYISESECKILGYSQHELIGHYAFLVTHPEDLPHVEHTFREIADLDGSQALIEYRTLHSDGSWRMLEVLLKNLLDDPNVNGIVANFHDITERKKAEELLQQAYDNALEGWAYALELRDKDTEGHTRRVTELAISLARAMNISEEQLVHIHRGAILHDIGKMAVSDLILQKPAPLTAEEMEIMCQHPRYAYEMLSRIEYLQPSLDIPYCHHERWDGTGYPRGLKGEEIPLPARIFTVVDVYDALTSNRPYRAAWSQENAINYITEKSGKYFDPQVVRTFLSLLEVNSTAQGTAG